MKEINDMTQNIDLKIYFDLEMNAFLMLKTSLILQLLFLT